MDNMLYICMAVLMLVSCSMSYVNQENIHHSDVDATTPHDHKNNVDVSPPSLGKDIIKGVRTVADVVGAAPARPPAVVPAPAPPVDDAARARGG